MCCFEEILVAKLHKTRSVQPLTSHLTNHSSKTNKESFAREVITNSLAMFSYGLTSIDWPAKIYIHQLYVDTRCNLEDLPGAMDYRNRWWGRSKEIHAINMTWGWWWWCLRFQSKLTLFRRVLCLLIFCIFFISLQ